MCQFAQCLHRVLHHHDVVDLKRFKNLLHYEVTLLLDWEVLLSKLDRSQESLGGHRCGWEPVAFLVVDGCDQSADNLILDGRVQVFQLELLTDEAEGLKRRLFDVELDVSRIAAQDVDQFGPLLEWNVDRSDRGDQVRDLRPHILRGTGELGEHGLPDHGFEVGVQFDPQVCVGCVRLGAVPDQVLGDDAAHLSDRLAVRLIADLFDQRGKEFSLQK